MQDAYRDLGGWISDAKLPIVYRDAYNITFMGIEKLHPFDSTKFRKVKRGLEKAGLVRSEQCVEASEVSQEILGDVHTPEYLRQLNTSPAKIAEVVQLPPISWLPNALVQRLNKTFRMHTAGTMLAIGLSVECGWSINLGGGLHHAHSSEGSGWCMYSDWYLGLRRIRKATSGRIQKALYIDLDVHQGNGVARDKLKFQDEDLFIFDMYNVDIWPGDHGAKRGISHEEAIHLGCEDKVYLEQLSRGLFYSFDKFKPDIVLYNAGTDVLINDPLGGCKVSEEGVKKRDEMVWQAARKRSIPICMCLSGGYAKESANVILSSISNLIQKFGLASQGASRL